MRKFITLFISISAVVFCISCSEDNPSESIPNTLPDGATEGMVLIPAKNAGFQMGSVMGRDNEKPVHEVKFTKNFWMDESEVTQSNYNNLMSEYYAAYQQPMWNAPYGVGDNHPAFLVFWGDAALYSNAKSKKFGLDTVYSYSSIKGYPGDGCELENANINYSANGYRLPTEAEWEFACRGGSASDFYWGADYTSYPKSASDSLEIDGYEVWIANSFALSSDDSRYGANQVKSKTPNVYGLYDMAGNVSEWVNDWFGDYSAESLTDPVGPARGDFRLIRGGNWGSDAITLRSANRDFESADYAMYFIGFRIILPVN